MVLIADVEQLNLAFADVDSRVPFILFKLLDKYGKGQEFEIDGPALTGLLAHEDPKMRVNSEEAAVVSTELKRFFEHNGAEWVPCPHLFGIR